MSGQWFVVTIPTVEHERVMKKKARGTLDIMDYPATATIKPSKKKLQEEQERLEEVGTKPRAAENVAMSISDEEGDDELREVVMRPGAGRRFGDTSERKMPTSRVFYTEDTPAERILEKIMIKVKIKSAVWNRSKNHQFWQVYFSVSSAKKSDWVLRVLNRNEITKLPGASISVLPTSLFFKSRLDEETEVEDLTDEEDKSVTGKWEHKKQQFLRTVRARMTVAQVVDGVRRNATLTFDFVVLIMLASIIAALGLAENSSVILVASMLISPLMGPILAGTFGAVIRDKKLRRQGITNELIGLGICLICGFLFGLVFGVAGDRWGSTYWPTTEMISRGQLRSLSIGLLIALPSGAGVALSVLGGNAGSLVGVAISASLLPPAVNAGMLWAFSIVKIWMGEEALAQPPEYVPSYHEGNMAYEVAVLGVVSLALTLLNIFCIFLTGVLVLKLKEVTPGASYPSMQRFWNQDIKIAREYNKSGPSHDFDRNVLNNLASMTEKEAPLGAEHEVKGLVASIEGDETLRNVRAFSMFPGQEVGLPKMYGSYHETGIENVYHQERSNSRFNFFRKFKKKKHYWESSKSSSSTTAFTQEKDNRLPSLDPYSTQNPVQHTEQRADHTPDGACPSTERVRVFDRKKPPPPPRRYEPIYKTPRLADRGNGKGKWDSSPKSGRSPEGSPKVRRSPEGSSESLHGPENTVETIPMPETGSQSSGSSPRSSPKSYSHKNTEMLRSNGGGVAGMAAGTTFGSQDLCASEVCQDFAYSTAV